MFQEEYMRQNKHIVAKEWGRLETIINLNLDNKVSSKLGLIKEHLNWTEQPWTTFPNYKTYQIF